MVKLTKIYTRTGDDGTTGLVDASRVAKDAARMEAIGAVDEANSAIGVAIAALDPGSALAVGLRQIQNEMFDLGADIATPFGSEFEPHALRIVARQVERIEEEIDAMNADLSPLTSFILPGGSVAVAQLHLARAIVRRAERAVVALGRQDALRDTPRQYLNRLSDLMFVLARVLNRMDGGDDVYWKSKRLADSA